MIRQEAQKLVGKTVFAWTGLRGCYIGELIEVLPTRPWRGRVKILAVVEYPVQGLGANRMFRERRPARFGEVWEFGGINIKPHEGEMPDYQASLENALRKKIEIFERMQRNSLTEMALQSLRRHLGEITDRQRNEGSPCVKKQP